MSTHTRVNGTHAVHGTT